MDNEYCFLNLRDFDNICRICAKFVDTEIISCSQIEKMLNLCTSVQVSVDDKLPQQICKTCFQNLESAYFLRQLSEKTYHALRRIIEEQSISNIKLEDNLPTNNDVNWCKELKKENEILEEQLEDNNSFDYQDNLIKVQEDKKILEKTKLKDESFEDNESVDQDSDWLELQIKPKAKKSTNKKTKIYQPKKKKKKSSDTNQLINEESDWSKEETKKKTKISIKNCKKKKYVHKKEKTKLIICHICGKIMTHRSSLHRHMISHEPKTTVLCKLCNKTFTHEKYLKDHNKRKHERKKLYLCQLCGMSCASVGNLNRHKLTHTGERPFACELCDKTSKTKHNLQQHIDRVHGDKRTETCSVCSLSFYDKKILEQHMRRHTGEKPFQCKECGRRFAATGGLWTHMKTHLKSVKKEK